MSRAPAALITAEDIKSVEQRICDSAYILLQLEVNQDANEAVAKLAKEHGVRVILNTAPYQPVTDEFLKGCWLVTPNEVEAEEMTGVAVTDLEARTAPRRSSSKRALRTCSSPSAAAAFTSTPATAPRSSPAFHVKAVDTTGAGDAFNGGLLAALAEGKDIWEAARFASGLAALSVQRIGTTPAMPTREEIDAFLAEHRFVSDAPDVRENLKEDHSSC